ncbi:hypothetical protein P886_3308 [Alteromonadaceae bacterium 2753L.S.0a.02]|nr:hypothetical protein P886_3308 [Alteromonadaceae bacterium 2753L.S.0a.02]
MSQYYLSEVASQMLKTLGQNMEAAIQSRESKSAFADRIGVSRETIRKMCQGKPGLDWGIWVASLDALGLLNHLSEVAAPEKDALGQSIRLGRTVRQVIDLDSDF